MERRYGKHCCRAWRDQGARTKGDHARPGRGNSRLNKVLPDSRGPRSEVKATNDPALSQNIRARSRDILGPTAGKIATLEGPKNKLEDGPRADEPVNRCLAQVHTQ